MGFSKPLFMLYSKVVLVCDLGMSRRGQSQGVWVEIVSSWSVKVTSGTWRLLEVGCVRTPVIRVAHP